jgi:hypothetical protein
MIRSILHSLLLVSLMLSTFTVHAFVAHPQLWKKSSATFPFPFQNTPLQAPLTPSNGNGIPTTTTTLFQGKIVDQGIGRGIPILGLVLLACVWLFTIPPEFRRAYICPDSCAKVEYQAAPACQECVTGEEWINGVKEYYKNGGGIQWDFSIDPNSKMMIGSAATTGKEVGVAQNENAKA